MKRLSKTPSIREYYGTCSRGLFSVFLVLVLGVSAVGPATAQVESDTASVLLRVAQGLESEGRKGLADSIYSLIVERYGISTAADRAAIALASLRETVQGRDGRIELIVNSTMFGGFLGLAIPTALGADDPSSYGVGLLVGPVAGYLFSRAYMHNNPVSRGEASAMGFG
ncbi:MAG: hypothetical protein OEZ54_03505, partial [Gemmatimonadota bacterium]|nr:hypothetical protein [Gemmatimonadota bacterium]